MEEDKYKTLESLRETKKFLNGIKGYLKEDEESVELDTLAAIALLRRPELAKRGDEALGDKVKDLTIDLYNFIDFIFDRELIIYRAMMAEALIRCAEAHNKGMTGEEVYKKYIGFEKSEDSLDNLYFNKRLNMDQKQILSFNYYVAFKETAFTSMAMEDYKKWINPDEQNKTK